MAEDGALLTELRAMLATMAARCISPGFKGFASPVDNVVTALAGGRIGSPCL
jgi:hypothetical protein